MTAKGYHYETGGFVSLDGKSALNFNYEVGSDRIQFWTSAGDVVILGSKEAASLAALLINQFPLDTLGNV
ncbi:MAG: hypothetical protein AB7L09_02465 [Nitrospira sp.]